MTSHSKPKQATFEMKEPPRFVGISQGKNGTLAIDDMGRVWKAREDSETVTWNHKTKNYAVKWMPLDTWTTDHCGSHVERYDEEL